MAARAALATIFDATSSAASTTLPTSTSTTCAVATTAIAPSSTTTYSYNVLPDGHYSFTYYIAVYHFENVKNTCDNYRACSLYGIEYQPNPDIGGIGAISAFLFTAWIVLVMTVVAYWGGLLPPELLRNADRKCFYANSRHNHSRWKNTFDDVILILSDQQLCFGIGILIAGYYQAFAQDLDISHWNMVTYLAWLSSTVHLMSLSLIRARLNENHLLRNIRLGGMLVLFILLLVALVPSTHNAGLSTFPRLYNTFPVRCSFSPFSLQDPYGFRFLQRTPWTQINPGVSYATLIIVYIWKVGQLFQHSAVVIQHYLRDAPRSKLQHWVQRTIPKTGSHGFLNFQHNIAKFCFLLWSVWAEALDSFMATFLALLFALAWGTEQLLIAHYAAPEAIRKGESAWSFGQILTLLLLLQPAMAVVETFSSAKPGVPVDGLVTATSSEITLAGTLSRQDSHIKPLAKSHTLSSTLSLNTQPSFVLAGRERTSLADPVVAHLYRSRMFKSYLYFIAVSFGLLAVAVVSITAVTRFPDSSQKGFVSLICLGGIIFVVPIVILSTWPCSRRLR